ESSRLLAEACRRQPKNFWVHREMGFVLVLEKRWLDATGYYRAALTLRPDNAGGHEGLGMGLSQVGQTEEALAAYRPAGARAPKTPSLHNRLVEALANAGYWKEAETACLRALEIDPGNHVTPLRLADILFRHHRHEDAIVMGRKATESAPDV